MSVIFIYGVQRSVKNNQAYEKTRCNWKLKGKIDNRNIPIGQAEIFELSTVDLKKCMINVLEELKTKLRILTFEINRNSETEKHS